MSRIVPWKWFLSTVCNVTWCLVRWRIPLLIRWLHISTTARYCKLHISFFFLKKLPIISSVLLKFPAQFNDSVFLLFIYFLVASSLPPSFFSPTTCPTRCWLLLSAGGAFPQDLPSPGPQQTDEMQVSSRHTWAQAVLRKQVHGEVMEGLAIWTHSCLFLKPLNELCFLLPILPGAVKEPSLASGSGWHRMCSFEVSYRYSSL